MKIKILFIGFICFVLLCSCTSFTKMTIQGAPGSLIYSNGQSTAPSTDYFKDMTHKKFFNNALNEYRGQVSNDGTLTTTQDDNAYIGLGFSINEEGTIPFAFDYKKNCSHAFTTVTGSITMWILPMWILGVPQVFLTRGSQDSYDNHYKYKKIQATNQDLKFTMPDIVLLDPPNSVKETNSNETLSSQSVVEATGQNNQSSQSGTVSQKKLKRKSENSSIDLTQKIIGRYVGTGSLTQKGETIEKYTGIAVTIKKVSDDIVDVNVIESNGDKFFTTDIRYTIQKNGNGIYSLTADSDKEGIIRIAENGVLQFDHKRIIIENNIYQLYIVATKK